MKNQVNLHPTYSLEAQILQSALYNIFIIITEYNIFRSMLRIIYYLIDLHAG